MGIDGQGAEVRAAGQAVQGRWAWREHNGWVRETFRAVPSRRTCCDDGSVPCPAF